MTVSVQQLTKELEIFGVDCEESLTEKCECLAPSRTPAEVLPARPARGSQPPSPAPRVHRGAPPGWPLLEEPPRGVGGELNWVLRRGMRRPANKCLVPQRGNENTKDAAKSLPPRRRRGTSRVHTRLRGPLRVWTCFSLCGGAGAGGCEATPSIPGSSPPSPRLGLLKAVGRLEPREAGS